MGSREQVSRKPNYLATVSEQKGIDPVNHFHLNGASKHNRRRANGWFETTTAEADVEDSILRSLWRA